MADIIYWYTINGHTAVRVVTTLNIDGTPEFVICLDARQHLCEMHRISISQYLGHVIHHSQIPFYAAIGLLFYG